MMKRTEQFYRGPLYRAVLPLETPSPQTWNHTSTAGGEMGSELPCWLVSSGAGEQQGTQGGPQSFKQQWSRCTPLRFMGMGCVLSPLL